MMAPRSQPPRLIDRLPPVRGRYRENAALAPVTWFRVGGPAEVVFRPADADDLAQFLKAKPGDVPVTVIGVGSNILVRDGGVPGVVIRLGRAFADIRIDGTSVRAGAAALDANVAKAAAAHGVAGLEFLAGVPGTIGGALRMNAGAYGRETADVLARAEAVSPDGALHRLSRADMGFAYRESAVPDDWIFTAATLQGAAGGVAEITARIKEIQAARAETQPIRTRTGGSTFKNPEGKNPEGKNPEGKNPEGKNPEGKNPEGARAWELIDAAGCRGLSVGGAKVSEQHCNFLINTGTATAGDLEALGEEVRRRVFETSGVTLEWEIRRIGVPAQPGPAGLAERGQA